MVSYLRVKFHRLGFFLVLFLLTVLTIPQISFGQSFLAKEHLTVFDKNDVKVGTVISIADENENPVWVALKIDETVILVRVFRYGFKGPSTAQAFFIEQDCQGTPFLQSDRVQGAAQMLPSVFIASPGQTVYVLNPDELSTTFYPQSKLSGNGSCEKLNLLNPLTLRPAKPLIDLSTIFTPPFSIQ